MGGLKILICDDHEGFRRSLAALLDGAEDVTVAANVADGEAAVEAANALQLDVALMDLTMPGIGGIEATRRILQNAPHVAVVVLTMVEDDDSVFAAMQAGAKGYLLKGARRDEIVRTIRAVAEGDAVFGSGIAGRLIRYFGTPSRQGRGVPRADGPRGPDPVTAGTPSEQPNHRPTARNHRENRQEQHLGNADQTVHRRPGAGHHRGTGRRPWNLTSRSSGCRATP